MKSSKINVQNEINALLIEDNLDDAHKFETMFNKVQQNSIFFHHVSSLTVAQDYIHVNFINLIILSISMPESKALEYINKIQIINSSLAIIILMEQDDRVFILKAMQQGVQDYLIKDEGDGYLVIRAIHHAMERKQIELQLTSMAYFDSLTGLANREYFHITFSRAIEQANRNKQSLSLLFLDLDHFKDVNDSFGHLIGDKLLIVIAERLRSCLRSIDFIARLGGDEFVILLDDIHTSLSVKKLVNKILISLSRAIIIETHEITISTSIGIVIYPDDALNTKDLLQYADIAMYKAKEKGRANFHMYTPELSTEIINKMNIKNDFRDAILRQELRLYYQPIINIPDNKIIAAEALLRWNHPTRGLLSANEFISIVEKSGFIIDIGEWVIAEAIKQTKKWQKNLLPKFGMAINLSATQLMNKGLMSFISAEIKQCSVKASTIKLEITESLLKKKNQQTRKILRNLSKQGFIISMDDFGTGYSSISYLKHFTIDILKIDHSFIHNYNSTPDTADFVKAIIDMAHALKLTVIAEGVEKEEQMTFLRKLNCDQIQGYLISDPVPALEFEQLFLNRNIQPPKALFLGGGGII
ncbi:MAG: GGDEF domain-containing response regulator [Methylococcaceae bacterium]|nr:GGDEF domain-containing response regulator [Methylococcaceae bacterium]